MSRLPPFLGLLGLCLFLAVALVFAACAGSSTKEAGAPEATPTTEALSTPSSGVPTGSTTQSGPPPRKTNSQGSVVIDVTWLEGWEASKQDPIRLKVEMNTHSVDLDKYKLVEISALRTNDGIEHRPQTWEGPKGGGHHLEGILKFSPADAAGKPVITKDTKKVELVIREVAGVKERLFLWELAN